MAGNLGALVGLASSSPNAAVILNGWPHEALGDELSRYFNLEAYSKCASACANQRSGRSVQKSGSHSATLGTVRIEPTVSSAGSVMLSKSVVNTSRVSRSGPPICGLG